MFYGSSTFDVLTGRKYAVLQDVLKDHAGPVREPPWPASIPSHCPVVALELQGSPGGGVVDEARSQVVDGRGEGAGAGDEVEGVERWDGAAVELFQ